MARLFAAQILISQGEFDKDELLDYIDELESENSDLQDPLDSIQDLVSPPAADDQDEDDQDPGDDAVDNAAAADDY